MSGSGTGTVAVTPVLSSSGTYTRFRVREEVRRIIRDPDFPKKDIDKAINSIISSLNTMGRRFKFHQGYLDITLVENQKAYSLTDFMAEELVVYDVDGEDEKILTKPPDLIDPYSNGWFYNTADTPVNYLFWGGQIWINPIPNSIAAGTTVRIYGYFHLGLLDDDTSIIPLNDHYCISILAWGAASEINPNLVIESSGKQTSISQTYSNNLTGMIKNEMWEPMVSHNIIRDIRWANLAAMGFIRKVR
jgi:hypothetical protein